MARRLDAEGIALVLGTTDPVNVDSGSGGIEELTLVGLDRVDSDKLLIEHSGATPAPEVRAFIWEQTHGNPAALIEITNALSREQLEGAEPLPHDVRVGIALQHTLTTRAGRLPEDTQTLLLVAAAEGTGDTAVILSAAQPLGVADSALEPAEVADVVHVGQGGLAFRDPLMRTAIYQGAPFGQRQAAHVAIAEALGDDKPDRRAWHRSAATVGPDDEVALELEQTAARSRSRAGHSAAATALERAADLSSDRSLAGRRLTTAASEALLAGRGQRARALAERAADLVDDRQVQAELDFTRARVEAGAGNRRIGFDLMLAASESIAATDVPAAARMLVEAGRLA